MLVSLNSRNGLLLGGFDLGSSSVEDLEKNGGPRSHTRVEVHLGALDVVVEIVTECVDEVNSLVSRCLVLE